MSLLVLKLSSSPNDAVAGLYQVCDVAADYALGAEDYTSAIRLHLEVLRNHPDNALAHYHLGFAIGIIGDTRGELGEYKRAEDLGLTNWDLFLNLGLAQLESGDLNAAADSLKRSVLFGESHSEAHFDLALVEQRRGMLAEAEKEAIASLRLNPAQADARDLLGVIYAEEGKDVLASAVWRELTRDVPDYEPARANLALLCSSRGAVVARRRWSLNPSLPGGVQTPLENRRNCQGFLDSARSLRAKQGTVGARP